ncbi:MAG: glycoside hydrolase family 3 C-terminal domain-containing protein [Actinobacteria bacterium]|nr:glycoside hydrolase family 3 C-terminal domain-containing protein [Actinomycetota bacterium]
MRVTDPPSHFRRRFFLGLLAACLFLALASGAAARGRCGSHPWCDTHLSPDARANLLLGALTEDEKIGLLGGDDFNGGVSGGPHAHTGTSDGVPRVDLPTTYYSDGPLGPRQGQATALPAPMGLAATFRPTLAFSAGSVVANEAKFKGNDVVFAPTVNIMRNPLGGRSFEAYGEDPFVDAQMAVQWIRGAQSQGVIADVKHFAANNQEGADPTGHGGAPGAPLGAGPFGSRYIVNDVVDERTLREIYLPHFEAAVKQAHVGTVMCAYNQVNGAFSCENRHLLQQILEHEWGFKGYVIADYGAAHNTINNLNNGLDFEAWPPWSYRPQEIQLALLSGQASQATLDGHVRRILRTLFAYGFFDRASYRDDDAQIPKRAHARAVRRIEESGITLLRNRHLLPLRRRRLKSIAVIGSPATKFVTGGGSGNVSPFSYASPLAAIRRAAGRKVNVSYDDGADPATAAAHAKASSVAIVFAADYETEGADRQCLTLECPNAYGDQDSLIQSVAAANPRTVVVLETGAPVLTPWRNRVGALLEAWYPGEQGGPALARVLFGKVDPGGRLPVTFPQNEGDTPTAGDQAKYPGIGVNVYYKEGVLVGYRWYDARRIKPAYPFGFGLSYTRFRYSHLRVRANTVTFTVRNVGRRTGRTVAELYVSIPSPGFGVVEPPRQLKGFAAVKLRRGRSTRVRLRLDARSLSYWDVAHSRWAIPRGCFLISVGRSSRDLPLHAVVARGGARCGDRD